MNLVYEIKYALENGFTTVEKLMERDGSIAYNGAFGYFVVSPGEAKEIDALISQYVTTPEKAKEIDALISQYKPDEKKEEIEAPVSISPKLTRLVESLEKSEAKVEKIKSTIERYYTRLEKNKTALSKKGIEIEYKNVKVENSTMSDFNESMKDLEKLSSEIYNDEKYILTNTFDLIYSVRTLLSDLRGAYKKLEESEKIVGNWHVKIVAEQTKNNFAAAAPKIIIDFVNAWGEKAFHWYMLNEKRPNEKSIRAMIENEKQIKIIQLASSVINVVGTITHAGGLSIGEKGDLNGIIEGEKGCAKVETISAGGYNVQRFHYRTIVTKI